MRIHNISWQFIEPVRQGEYATCQNESHADLNKQSYEVFLIIQLGIHLQCFFPRLLFLIGAGKITLDVPCQNRLFKLKFGSQEMLEEVVIAHPSSIIIQRNTEQICRSHYSEKN